MTPVNMVLRGADKGRSDGSMNPCLLPAASIFEIGPR
jgi:hypothetical protein